MIIGLGNEMRIEIELLMQEGFSVSFTQPGTQTLCKIETIDNAWQDYGQTTDEAFDRALMILLRSAKKD